MNNKELMEGWARRHAERIVREREEALKKPKTPEVKAEDEQEEIAGEKGVVITPSSDAFFLEGDYGKEFLKEYNGIVKIDYSDNSVLKVLNWNEEGNIVTGSSDYSVVLANKIFRDRGEKVRTANSSDLAEILKAGRLDLKGYYEDAGLVLRTLTKVNEYLAGVLYEDIKQKKGNVKMPFMISLSDLELKIDPNSPSKLAFVSGENANPIYSDKFNHANNQRKFNETDEYGLPIFIQNGKRTWYTREDGLAGFYLVRGLDLGSLDGGLPGSYADARVVVVRCAEDEKNGRE